MTEQELNQQYQQLIKKKHNDEFEITFFLNDLSEFICKNIFGIKKHPIVFFDEIEEENSAKFCLHTLSVIINNKNINDLSKSISHTLHELEHYYQYFYIHSIRTSKAERWKEEFKNYSSSIYEYTKYISQEIEIDAIAFSQIFSSILFNIKIKHQIREVQDLVDAYINKKIILED